MDVAGNFMGDNFFEPVFTGTSIIGGKLIFTGKHRNSLLLLFSVVHGHFGGHGQKAAQHSKNE